MIDRDGTTYIISNPAEFPNPQEQAERGAKFYEPMVEATMIFPSEYLGDVIELCEVSRLFASTNLTDRKIEEHSWSKTTSLQLGVSSGTNYLWPIL